MKLVWACCKAVALTAVGWQRSVRLRVIDTVLMLLLVVSKAQQLLQGLQSKDEAQQVAAVTEMCQVFSLSDNQCSAVMNKW